MSESTEKTTNNVNCEIVLNNSDHKTEENQNNMEEIHIKKDITNGNSNNVEGLSGNIVINRNMDITERVQNIKSWGFNTFMRTRQKVKEKLSRTSRTIDIKLEDQIDRLKLQKSQYGVMVVNNQRTIEQLAQISLVHQCAGRMNSEFSQTERTLTEDFLRQSQLEAATVNIITDLINKLACSNETLETLVNKTFVDLMKTIEIYENARVEFDAYKTETVRLMSQLQQKKDINANDQIRLQDMQQNLEQRRIRYEKNKSNVEEKIELLEDHKNRVVQRELINCQHAWFNYYSQCSDLFSESKSNISRSVSKSEVKEEPDSTEN